MFVDYAGQTLEKLRQLKFHGMAQAFEDELQSTEYAPLSFEERLGLMVDREMTQRENRRHGLQAALIASQIPSGQWHELMDNPTVKENRCGKDHH